MSEERITEAAREACESMVLGISQAQSATTSFDRALAASIERLDHSMQLLRLRIWTANDRVRDRG